jgi:hypothetical protein
MVGDTLAIREALSRQGDDFLARDGLAELVRSCSRYPEFLADQNVV